MKWPLALGVGAGGLIAVLSLSVWLVLAAADQGALDGPIQNIASAKLRRPVHFNRLKTHLLAMAPMIDLDGLVIGSPPAVTGKPLLRANHVSVRLHLASLLWGRLEATQVTIAGADLHLVRVGPTLNNYNFGGSTTGAALRSIRNFSALGGHVTYEDPPRHLSLDATFDHDGRPGPGSLTMKGGGVINGEPFNVVAQAGALNARAPDAAYPLHADVTDGDTTLRMTGQTQKPFDFRTLDLNVAAKGPNLADLGYLFNFSAPNSPPFDLTTRLRRSNHVSRLLGLRARVGATDLAGDITSDHSGPRRAFTAHLFFHRLDVRDLKVLSAKPPAHAEARSQAGQAAQKTPSALFSTQPFHLDQLRQTDADVNLKASQVIGAAAPARNLILGLRLQGGRLTLSPASAELDPGVISGEGSIDASAATPAAEVRVSINGARLSKLRPDLKPQANADVNLRLTLSGSGTSAHAIAMSLSGEVAFDLRNGTIAKVKAAALGGDLVKAAALSLAGNRATTSIACGVGIFPVAAGVLTAKTLSLVTGEGEIVGRGTINLGDETVALGFERRAPAGLFTPVTITGPIRGPKVSINAGETLQKAGVRAVTSVLSLPAAIIGQKPAQSDERRRCDTLLTDASSLSSR